MPLIKPVLVLCLLMLFLSTASGQTNKQDSLSVLLRSAKDTSRVNILNQLSATYWYSDPQKTLDYAKEAALLAKQIQFNRGLATAYNNTGIAYYQQNKYAEALKWYEQAVQAHKDGGNFRGEARVITNMGLIYWKQGEYPTAVKHYMMALKIWEAHHIEDEKSSIYDNLGNVYSEQEQFDTALAYYRHSLEIQEKYSRSPHEISMTLSNAGTAYLGKQMPKEALEYFLKSLTLLEPDEKESRAVSLSNIGLTYVEMKEYARALPYLTDALKLQEEIEDNDGKIHTLIGISKIYSQTGKLGESVSFADSALSVAESIGDKAAIAMCLLALSDVANIKGDYKNALGYFRKYIEARDSIQSKENIFKIASLRAGIETEKKQAELELLKKESEQKEFRRNAIYTGLIALLLIAGLIVSRQRLKLKQNVELVLINKRLTNQSEQLEEQTRKLQELDKVKSTFFANISHEFRTPLTLILNSLSDRIGSMKKDEDAETAKQFELMHRNAKRLLNLVNQLLDLSKLEAGEMKLNPQNCDLTQLLHVVYSSFSSLSEARKVDFQIAIPEEPIICRIDVDKIEKILFNLLSNAFKFTPVGGTVYFTAELKKDEQNKNIVIAVEDSGPGIAENELHNIFNRFYQGNQYYSDMQGTGIGLALAKDLVELHGGMIRAESGAGRGAKLTVTVPLSAATGELVFSENRIIEKEYAAVQAQAATEIFDNQDDRPTVLVVEDNEDLREYIKKNLADNYRVIEAENGVRGSEKAIEIVPDVIISDWMMPEMDGAALCKRLKNDERTSHIPFILLTALAANDSKLQGLENGADEYLTKPFDNRELLVRVRNLIETRRQLREKYSRELHLGPKKIPVSSMDERFLEKVMEAVETHMGDPEFSMEKFGQQVSLSRMQLHRKLKALTGESPGDFLRKMRLRRAKRLLESKSGNVSEIGYEVGFNNLSYFSKCYRDEYGISPSSSILEKENSL